MGARGRYTPVPGPRSGQHLTTRPPSLPPPFQSYPILLPSSHHRHYLLSSHCFHAEASNPPPAGKGRARRPLPAARALPFPNPPAPVLRALTDRPATPRREGPLPFGDLPSYGPAASGSTAAQRPPERAWIISCQELFSCICNSMQSFSKMSSNRLSSTNGDARLTFPSMGTTLNPNAAEFVPSSFRSTSGSSTVGDVSKSDFRVSSGKTILDRSESSKSNSSDDEAHQFWRRQLPDDIIPDFGDMEKVEQKHEQLSLVGLSLNAPPFFGAALSNLSREHRGLLSQAVKNLEQGHSYSYYDENLEPTLPSLGSKSWEQNHADNLHFSNGKLDLDYDDENNAGYFDSLSHEYVTATDGVVDPLEYLASQYPGFSAESLAELYYANGCDFNLTIEILTQLEVHVDSRSLQNLNLTPTTQNFSTGDFPSLPTEEDLNCSFQVNTDTRGTANGHNSSIISSGSGDFVSAVRRLASQDVGHWKFEKKSSEYGSSVSTTVAQKQYSSNARSSFGNKFHTTGKGGAAPVWLETGDAVANMYSESRGEAHEFAHIRNIFFEQARQSHLIGNKVLAKELSMKEQLYNMQMKSAHEKAREAIYQQRNPVSSEHVQDHLIDLHGLHVSEAIHTLKVELAAMTNAARAAGERVQAMVCVGTGHQTKGSRTARLPVAVEQFLLDEGLHYTQPQPGLLRVALY